MERAAVLVLVIDDEPMILEIVEMMLQQHGYDVHTTENARDSLALARELQPDLILCDASMPGMSGPDTIGLLRADEATKHIPIVLMTGHPAAEAVARLGLQGFLQKPFQPEELKTAVESALP